MSCIEVVKVFVFTECYELSTVRNDTPIYKEHSDKQRSRVYFVYIQVNVKICTHVSPWLNFSNTEVGTSNPFDVYVSVYRLAYPQSFGVYPVKKSCRNLKNFTNPLNSSIEYLSVNVMNVFKLQYLFCLAFPTRFSVYIGAWNCHYVWTIVYYSLYLFKSFSNTFVRKNPRATCRRV